MSKVERLRRTGTFSTWNEAIASLVNPGDAALVCRGVPRLLLLKCPCGCGDNLILNLDGRAGPAWRLYVRQGSLSVFPSYWRDSACESHFVLWQDRIYWCEWDDEDMWQRSSAIENRVFKILPPTFVKYEQLAEELQEIPWEVLQACYSLVRKGRAEMNSSRRTGEFRRSDTAIEIGQ
jgi:hypothetical protein